MSKTHNKKKILWFYLYVYFLLPLLNSSAQNKCCDNLFNNDEIFEAIREFRVSEVALTFHLLPKGHTHSGNTTPFTIPEVMWHE